PPLGIAKIQPDSPQANVLYYSPSAPQAQDAVIAKAIPQTAKVNIAETHLTVTYDGTPKFENVADALGLDYAVNSPMPVVYVKQANTYYCVNNGVWFYAPAPVGPWVVASSVPGAIYSIPL